MDEDVKVTDVTKAPPDTQTMQELLHDTAVITALSREMNHIHRFLEKLFIESSVAPLKMIAEKDVPIIKRHRAALGYSSTNKHPDVQAAYAAACEFEKQAKLLLKARGGVGAVMFHDPILDTQPSIMLANRLYMSVIVEPNYEDLFAKKMRTFKHVEETGVLFGVNMYSLMSKVPGSYSKPILEELARACNLSAFLFVLKNLPTGFITNMFGVLLSNLEKLERVLKSSQNVNVASVLRMISPDDISEIANSLSDSDKAMYEAKLKSGEYSVNTLCMACAAFNNLRASGDLEFLRSRLMKIRDLEEQKKKLKKEKTTPPQTGGSP